MRQLSPDEALDEVAALLRDLVEAGALSFDALNGPSLAYRRAMRNAARALGLERLLGASFDIHEWEADGT